MVASVSQNGLKNHTGRLFNIWLMEPLIRVLRCYVTVKHRIKQKSWHRAATVAIFCVCGEMPSLPQQVAVCPCCTEPVQLSCECRQLQNWCPVRHVPDGIVSWTDCHRTDWPVELTLQQLQPVLHLAALAAREAVQKGAGGRGRGCCETAAGHFLILRAAILPPEAEDVGDPWESPYSRVVAPCSM